MSESDLTSLLSRWPYEPGRINARRIDGLEGRPKLQVRLELGLLHMEVTGRPDGLRPEGFDSLLALHENRLNRYTAESGGRVGFVISPEDCKALREEAAQIHHRYVAQFALGDFAAVVADIDHAMRIFDLCRDYGVAEADRTALEQFRPHLVTMRSRSEAELALAKGRSKDAVAALDRGLAALRALFDEAGQSESFADCNDVQLLLGMREALVPKLPVSQRVELQERLRAALDAENYELAAILRDEMRLMSD